MIFISKFLISAKLPQHHSTQYQGLDLIIEWPKGSVRVGVDDSGNRWRRTMLADYGYVPHTTAAGDKENLDVYIGPNTDSDKVYVVEQLKKNGDFDEYKCLLGFDTLDEAYDMYLAHYPEGWGDDRVGEVYEVPYDYVFDEIEKHQESKQAAMESPMSYIWVSPGENDDRIVAGGFADHWKFQDNTYTKGNPITTMEYDNSPRGYAEVRDFSKTISLSLSPACSYAYAFIPDSVVKNFQAKFPGYKVYKNATKKASSTKFSKTAKMPPIK
jgi:hypothetical protein